MECFEIRRLSFSYADETQPTLSDISFSVASGEFVVLCGLSGSGKSTLLRQLKTCLQPYGRREGEILFEGIPLSAAAPAVQAASIGFVSQSPEHQSVTDKVWHELAFGLEGLGVPPETIRRRTAEIAAFFGIEAWLHQSIDALSGGQRQLLQLASVMVTQPSVLLLDEPTSQLDPIASYELITLLKRINRELGTTIIMSEHHLEEVYALSSRILVLSGGRLIADTTPQKLSLRLYEAHEPTFLSLPVPARLFHYLNGKTPDRTEAPLSVTEGRQWLRDSRLYSEWKLPAKEPLPAAKPPVVSLREIWFRYEKNAPDILQGIRLDLPKGEITAILGGNGSGKTTLLELLCGLNRPYRGTIRIDGKKQKQLDPSSLGIALLPQNPETLFTHSTVREELTEMLSAVKDTSEAQQRLQQAVTLCELQPLLEKHPYDLSGGEKQKAALAKLLLLRPRILLLDEPTKGLDCFYQRRLAVLLRRLSGSGVTIVLVSHDIEFCACNADRCTMLFDGRLLQAEEPRTFFAHNQLYTTAVCRMTRGLFTGAVTVNEVLQAAGCMQSEDDFFDPADFPPNASTTPQNQPHQKEQCRGRRTPSLFRVVGALFCLLIFLLSVSVTAGSIRLPFVSEHPAAAYGAMFVSAFLLMLFPQRGRSGIYIRRQPFRAGEALLLLSVVLLAVPLTIFVGIHFFHDAKYLFISLMIMLEGMLPLYLLFEKQRMRTRELVILAVLCTLCVAGRGAFYMLPQFKPVTALVILSAVAFGSASGFMVGSVSMLASNLFFGQGIWTPWQMFAMGLIGWLAGGFFHRFRLPVNRFSLSVFGFAAALLYGGIMNPATLIMSRMPLNIGSLLTVYAVGLPLDVVHAVSTALFLYWGAVPVLTKIERVKQKYGLIR